MAPSSTVRTTASAPPSHLLWTLSSHKGPVHTAVYNSGSNYVLTGGQDRLIKLWNPKTGMEVKTYGGHGYEVLGLAWSVACRLCGYGESGEKARATAEAM